MITLIRPFDSNLADEIEKRLKDLVLAYDVSSNDTVSKPYLLDSGNLVKGRESIMKFLDMLRKELDFSRSLSADACVIDPDSGETC